MYSVEFSTVTIEYASFRVVMLSVVSCAVYQCSTATIEYASFKVVMVSYTMYQCSTGTIEYVFAR